MKRILTAATVACIFFAACKKGDSSNSNTPNLATSLDGSYKMTSAIRYTEDSLLFSNGDTTSTKYYDTAYAFTGTATVANNYVTANSLWYRYNESSVKKVYTKSTGNTTVTNTSVATNLFIPETSSGTFTVNSTDSLSSAGSPKSALFFIDGLYKGSTFKYTISNGLLTITGAYYTHDTGGFVAPHPLRVSVTVIYQKQ